MPRPKSLIPKLCIDKSRNRAFCKVDGKFLVLGPAGSPQAQAAYGKLLSDLAQLGTAAAIQSVKQRESVPGEPFQGITLNDVFLRFVSEEISRYSSAEQYCIKGTIKVARELFGNTAVEAGSVEDMASRKASSSRAEFSAHSLSDVQQPAQTRGIDDVIQPNSLVGLRRLLYCRRQMAAGFVRAFPIVMQPPFPVDVVQVPFGHDHEYFSSP